MREKSRHYHAPVGAGVSPMREARAPFAPQSLPPLLDHVQATLRRAPRQARSRAKVQALVAAAERLFVERGYDAVPADAIAAAAGVSTGTFYSYFGDKRDILMVLLAEQVDALLGLGPADDAPPDMDPTDDAPPAMGPLDDALPGIGPTNAAVSGMGPSGP